MNQRHAVVQVLVIHCAPALPSRLLLHHDACRFHSGGADAFQ